MTDPDRWSAKPKRHISNSFMGRHFPASDIPHQARQLYLRNTIRVIPDASGAFVEIEPVIDASGNPLDLSFASLRSVSPIHCEYLRNMGVAASMSVSVIVAGRSVGADRVPSLFASVIADAAADRRRIVRRFLLAPSCRRCLRKQSLDTATHARRALDSVLRNVAHHTDLARFLRDSICDFGRIDAVRRRRALDERALERGRLGTAGRRHSGARALRQFGR